MARKNLLTTSPPYPVEQAIRRLGANLRMARLRRNLSIEDAAEKIGTGRRAVIEAEKGKTSAGAAVYMALLWAYDLLGPMESIADPAADREGLALASSRERARARDPRKLDDEF